MSFFVRKINKPKWKLIDKSISSDAITSCLRTTSNTLSFWKIEKEDDEYLEKAIIPITSCQERVEAVDFIIIEEDFFKNNGISFKQDTATTPATKLNELHINLVDLNYERIGVLSNKIFELVSNKKVIRKTKKQATELLLKGIEESVVDSSLINDKLKAKISDYKK